MDKKIKLYKITNKGKVRKNNEDSLYASQGKVGALKNLFIIADGVGGNKGGQEASKLVVKTVYQTIKKDKEIKEMLKNDNKSDINYKTIFQKATTNAASTIFEKGANNEKLKGMCSTMLLATIDKNKLYVANVGDSRLYILSSKEDKDESKSDIKTISRSMMQITQDNAEIVETKIIPDKISKNLPSGDETMDKIKSLVSRRRYLTKAVGSKKDVLIDYYEFDLAAKLADKKDVRVLMITDGFYDMLNQNQMMDILVDNKKSGNYRLKELVKEANKKGGRDNMTAILIEFTK